MRSYVRTILYLIILNLSSNAIGGSYEDFFVAIKQDNSQVVTALLKRGFDPNTLSSQGLSGLYLALRDSSLKVAQTLIDWPATNIEVRTPQDESPLMMAALRGNLELCKKLLKRDADINKQGWTPLHYAATNGHLAVIELLLENNAYIDAQSPNGTTPLMMAAHYGSPAAVKELLQAGADPALKNQLGLTAIDFAFRGGRANSAELIADSLRTSRKRGSW